MPPKQSKKEKAAERAAELARLEEERILAEEEAARAAAEEAARRAAEEEARREAEEKRLAAEAVRLDDERAALLPFLEGRAAALALLRGAQRDAEAWERYLACVPLPLPDAPAAMSEYLSEKAAAAHMQMPLSEALALAADNERVIAEAEALLLGAVTRAGVEKGGVVATAGAAEALAARVGALRELSRSAVDCATARLLARAEELADSESGEVRVAAQTSERDSFGLWCNHGRNPRVKTVAFPEHGVSLELPKPLVLASVALRVRRTAVDEFAGLAEDGHMALGPVLHVELLQLPQPPKRAGGWTMRAITPLTTGVQRLPYPIPPAGSDLQASAAVPGTPAKGEGGAVAASAAPPMTVTMPVPADAVVLRAGAPRVGWWDALASCWRTDGVEGAAYGVSEDGRRSVTFSTPHLTSFALLQPRARLLPYAHWALRPTAEAAARLTLRCAVGDVELDVTEGGVALAAPALGPLAGLIGESMPPRALLNRLSRCGLHLLPEDRDAPFVVGGAAVVPKDADLEHALCADAALLAPSFVVASSAWNAGAGRDVAHFRALEVGAEYFRVPTTHARLEAHLKKRGACFLRRLKDVVRVELPEGDASTVAAHDPVELGDYHASLVVLIRKLAGAEAVARVERGSVAFCEHAKDLMLAMRLFSFG